MFSRRPRGADDPHVEVSRFRADRGRRLRVALLAIAAAVMLGGSAFAATGGSIGTWIRGRDHAVPVVPEAHTAARTATTTETQGKG